jgi:dUTP pyrophosphatase
MKIGVMLDEGAKMPTKAHDTDAGFDLYTPKELRIREGGSAKIDTGVHIEIPKGYVGFLKSKSGLNVQCGITGEGVIDAGYTGSIVVKLYNHGRYIKKFNSGDKLTQIVILPIFLCDIT